MFNFQKNDEAMKQHLERVGKNSLITFGRNKEILTAFLGFYKQEKSYIACRNQLQKILWTEKTKKLSNIFSNSEYKVLELLLGKHWAEKFKAVWDHSSDYTYTIGYDRRSFRSKTNETLYFSAAIDKLYAMFHLVSIDFTLEKYFAGTYERDYALNLVIANLIAVEADKNNKEVMGRIEEIFFAENNTALVTRGMIKGLLMSKNEKAHKLVGDLLLAAKLQEGLRQTIVECMDEGSREGFLYILKIIIDHNLIRFSAVVRALDVWTGLGIAAEKSSVVKKSIETAYQCLTDSTYQEDCLKSNDALLIYMGLWSIAFDDIGRTESRLKELFSSREKYKKLVALYFLSQTKYPTFQHSLAVATLDDPDFEVKSWVLRNLFPDTNNFSLREEYRINLEKYEGMITSEDLFNKLKNILDTMPKRELRFKESVFSWCESVIACDDIIHKMMFTLVNHPSASRIDYILDYKGKMNVDTRSEFVNAFLKTPQTPKQKTALFEFMGDKSRYVRKNAMRHVTKLDLDPEDYRSFENLLKYKGDLRKNAISMLLMQSSDRLLVSIKRLLADKDENKQLAALDIITAIEKDTNHQSILDECKKMVDLLTDTSPTAKILTEKITKGDPEVISMKEGLGLFQPNKEITVPKIPTPKSFTTKDVLSSTIREIKTVLQSFSDLVDRYKDYEYEVENWNGGMEKTVLGGGYSIRSISSSFDRNTPITLDDYPLREVWREAAREHHLTTTKLLEIHFYFRLSREKTYMQVQDWYQELLDELFPIEKESFIKFTENLPYSNHIKMILLALLHECPQEEVYKLCKDMTVHLYHQIPRELFAEDYEKTPPNRIVFPGAHRNTVANAPEISFWYYNLCLLGREEKYFKEFFNLGYTLYRASKYNTHTCLQLEDFERAFSLGLVDENELMKELCIRPRSIENLRNLTKTNNPIYKSLTSCEKLLEVYDKIAEKIVYIELKRGDMTTEVSHLVSNVYKFSGTRFFVDILVGIGKETYVRGYNFVGDDSTKKQMFSHILKYCYPAKGEDENTLKELLINKKVTEKQLVDAAMYSPQWLDIVEKYLDWPGLKSAGWYFHAHINENFTKEKETIVSRYTPVTPEDLKTGAFDINWFKESYSLLGQKRFKVVYNSAKYIAGGGLHKRSQLFTDATLGNISIEQAETRIKDKRNKDYVLCYGLIPFIKGKEREDMLHRYDFLQAFLKESKQFGAQRRISEGKAVSIAMENLARNAGFSDTNRFIWNMEIEKIKSIQPFLEPATLGDFEIHIEINELGKPEIAVTKAEKTLKSIPAKIKNNNYVKELKSVHKSLKEQSSRARHMLEKAMEEEDFFTATELEGLSKHPIIYPLIKSILFKCGDSLGYFENRQLVGENGQSVRQLETEEQCIIAHPVHLYQSGQWADFQKNIYHRGIVQPFKQVFREFYTPNADELESRIISRRYEGHQVQPKKAAALLKSRGWTVSYEDGLQKVYYKENIVAQIYAVADWFSPADVEAPTLEWIQFTHRKTGNAIPFTEISQVIFSEIMRDIDLVVSVAHVGGVDPEASLSTVEMRTSIIGETVRLLKLSNVELKGSHAFIKGNLGEYTVHLGSGVVHKMASGALHILPVHSQHRGRIFLPFIDDDPKTAEITSKIVMLAEDKKIKDPTVLVQISG